MAVSPLALLRTVRLGPLALTQACGAFNDNLVKNAMVVFALFTLGQGGAGLSALAGALFIAPYLLLSATAGQLADRYPKSRVIFVTKLAECVLMLAAAAAFLAGSVPGLLAVLFGLGVQAAMFGPVKYGVLPELLRPEELVAGNGVIEAGTFLAIVGGTVVGGMLALLPAGPALVSALGLAVSVLGVVSARWIPAQQAADRRLRIRLNIVAETWHLVRQAFAHPTIRWSILGISWFWLVGATLMTEFPVLARDTIGADGSVLTLFLTVFAVGVGLGSIGAARVLHGRLSGRWVPVAGLVISVFLWEFAASAHAAAGFGLHSAGAMVSSWWGLRVLGDLLVLAAAGGLFSVPLYALMQDAADASRRSRTIAANNVINALFMVAGAGLTAALATAGLDAPAVLQAAAGANLCVAIGLARVWAPRPFGLGS
ncbi:MAG: MFS transporter [Rhodospirillales bacterium]|nr:MFS transporter [Rhodospirillales bacterium]